MFHTRIIFFLFAVATVGCARNSANELLCRADRLINERPDSAYSLLQTVVFDNLRSEGQRA